MTPSIVRHEIVAVQHGRRSRQTDAIVVEQPMEIRVNQHSVAVTMRTPGNDFELAAGFLFTEGIVRDRCGIERIAYCAGRDEQHYNIVTVHLRPDVAFDPARLSRHVYTTSSCGICGKASLDQVRAVLPDRPLAAYAPGDDLLVSLPDKLRQAQAIFGKTGGLHAAALFDTTGQLRALREDVGRHNAVDKLIGALLLKDSLPAAPTVLVVSGRASFELARKTLMAGIPALAAIGAPTSLAIELAREFGLTLIGFLRGDRFNLYP